MLEEFCLGIFSRKGVFFLGRIQDKSNQLTFSK